MADQRSISDRLAEIGIRHVTAAEISEELEALRRRFWKAETAEEHAEICRLEAELMGGPFYCPCGAEPTSADTTPCRVDHGICAAA